MQSRLTRTTPARSSLWSSPSRLLWFLLVAFAVVQLLDALTTVIGFDVGLTEKTAFNIWILSRWGVYGLVLSKIGYALAVFVLGIVLRRFLSERVA